VAAATAAIGGRGGATDGRSRSSCRHRSTHSSLKPPRSARRGQTSAPTICAQERVSGHGPVRSARRAAVLGCPAARASSARSAKPYSSSRAVYDAARKAGIDPEPDRAMIPPNQNFAAVPRRSSSRRRAPVADPVISATDGGSRSSTPTTVGTRAAGRQTISAKYPGLRSAITLHAARPRGSPAPAPPA
jgi:hypothetical protein